MIKIATALIIAGGLACTLMGAGCTQMPTEKQSISDMRPQISFKVDSGHALNARVILNDLDMGAVGEYVEHTAALRILPGTHMLRVSLENQVILEEKFYITDGVNRTFILK